MNQRNNAGFYPQRQNYYPQQRQAYAPYANQPPYNNQPPPQFKRSGATYSKIRNGNFVGETIVNAWRVTKNGLMTATCTPYNGANGKGSQVVESEKHEYKKMICTVKNTSMGTSQTFHVLMNVKTQVISINELSLCITPNGSGRTKSGKNVKGYFGRNYKK